MAFPGGSAYAMARDVAEGFATLSERNFRTLSEAELTQLAFELDRHLRELRGLQAPQDDVPAIQLRNRRMGRLTTALTLLRGRKAARR
jgi:hypothetical protein